VLNIPVQQTDLYYAFYVLWIHLDLVSIEYVFVILTENKEVGMGAIIITTDLLLMMDNLQWLFPKSDLATQTYRSQKISNLIEVVSIEKCKYLYI
jgi:hypothetical protein